MLHAECAQEGCQSILDNKQHLYLSFSVFSKTFEFTSVSNVVFIAIVYQGEEKKFKIHCALADTLVLLVNCSDL